MATQKDKYDLAVEWLTEHPEEIQAAWGNPWEHKGGCLFLGVSPWGSMALMDNGETCGCLTQVAGGVRDAWTQELTQAIRQDKGLPKSRHEIAVSHLPLFAKWQRRIDKELGRKP